MLPIHDIYSLKKSNVENTDGLLVKYCYDYNVTVLSLAVSNVTTEVSSFNIEMSNYMMESIAINTNENARYIGIMSFFVTVNKLTNFQS